MQLGQLGKLIVLRAGPLGKLIILFLLTVNGSYLRLMAILQKLLEHSKKLIEHSKTGQHLQLAFFFKINLKNIQK